MGCDIHMYAEVKRCERWETVGHVFDFGWNNPNQATVMLYLGSENNNAYEFNRQRTMEVFDRRDYRLFTILAGVRRVEHITPISEPRGLPEDVSEWIRNESNRWGVDGHSHSWLTLEELKSYPWDEPIPEFGWVSLEEYRKYKLTGRPTAWSDGVGGGNVVHVSNEEMDKFLVDGPPDEDKSYYTQIMWFWPSSEACRYFYRRSLPQLEKLLQWEDVDDVRTVFWFDN